MMWRGIAIGVIISAPMGPVGILCVQRTLEKGRSTGFFTGVGASISDLFYCLVTGFGLSFIEGFLKANQNAIQIIGSIVLVVFGIYLFRSNPARTLKKPGAERVSRGKNVLSGFLFTFSNPLIIFLIIGLFARFNFLLPEISFFHYVIGYVFIIIGALMWWWIVSYFVDKVRAHFNLRSMWLINKITGGIIMIFALVGIFTAVSGMASADSREPVYLNSSRGFGSLGRPDGGGPLILTNTSCDTVTGFLPLHEAEEFSFSFRAANLHNQSGRHYTVSDSSGRKERVVNPAWGIVLAGEGKRFLVRVSTADLRDDDLLPVSLDVECRSVSGSDKVSLSRGVDLFIGENSYRLDFSRRGVSLMAGNRDYNPVFDNVDACLRPDSIGFFVEPGASLRIDNVALLVRTERKGSDDWSHFADPDVRYSYFGRSADDIEGEWEMFDRMLEDDCLRSGGNYSFAIVRSRDGYDMVYLDGAVKNSSAWTAGRTKARLRPTSFRNVFDVEWLDPSSTPLQGEIKAQFSAPDIIRIQFSDHGSSSLRLRKK